MMSLLRVKNQHWSDIKQSKTTNSNCYQKTSLVSRHTHNRWKTPGQDLISRWTATNCLGECLSTLKCVNYRSLELTLVDHTRTNCQRIIQNSWGVFQGQKIALLHMEKYYMGQSVLGKFTPPVFITVSEVSDPIFAINANRSNLGDFKRINRANGIVSWMREIVE